MIAGLTVIPETLRQGVAANLLGQVLRTTSRRALGEPFFSVINAENLASIDPHLRLGFLQVDRSASFADIEFTGGEGVLMRRGCLCDQGRAVSDPDQRAGAVGAAHAPTVGPSPRRRHIR